jgi:hypothetical protein
MEAEETLNPWITVPKRKRNSAFGQNDATKDVSPKSGVETLQSNSFLNLSLQESMNELGTPNTAGMTLPGDIAHPLPSPGVPVPPRKKPKKDLTKVLHPLNVVDFEKSHYPIVKIREDSINRQVNLTVSSRVKGFNVPGFSRFNIMDVG